MFVITNLATGHYWGTHDNKPTFTGLHAEARVFHDYGQAVREKDRLVREQGVSAAVVPHRN